MGSVFQTCFLYYFLQCLEYLTYRSVLPAVCAILWSESCVLKEFSSRGVYLGNVVTFRGNAAIKFCISVLLHHLVMLFMDDIVLGVAKHVSHYFVAASIRTKLVCCLCRKVFCFSQQCCNQALHFPLVASFDDGL